MDGIDKVVTDEMQSGRSLLEESLTFVLARLLDGQSTFQRILEYPRDKLNVALDACGSGSQMLIEFETNEHKKSGFSFAGSIVRLSAHDEVCNGWTSIDNYTGFFLCVLRALCGELYISTIQSGSYLAWQLGQMRIILQVSFVTRTNEVWKPSSYPQLGQIWSSFSIFIETGFGILFSKYLLLYLLLMPLLLLVQSCRLNHSFLLCWFNWERLNLLFLPIDTIQRQ